MVPEPAPHGPGPLSVTLVESAARLGGVEHSTLTVAGELARRGWRVQVVCPEDGPLIDRCNVAGLRTSVVGLSTLRSVSIRINGAKFPNALAWCSNLGSGWSWSRRLRSFLANNKTDVVITKGITAHVFAAAAARKAGIPVVWHLQDLVSPGVLGCYQGTLNWLAERLADHIVCDGRAIRAAFPRTIQTKCSVVLNSVELDEFSRPGDGSSFRKELGIPGDAVVIGNVARLTPWKGQDHLIRAFARLEDNEGVWLVLVGSPVFDNDRFEKKLRQLVTSHGIEDRVVFAGYRTDLPNVLSAFDVFAYTSLTKDTSPLSLLSALAVGLPVIAYSIDGTDEILGGQHCASLVPCGAVGVLAEAISQLIVSPERRQEMGRAARALAEEQFNISGHVDRIEGILRSVIRDSSERARRAERPAEDGARRA